MTEICARVFRPSEPPTVKGRCGRVRVTLPSNAEEGEEPLEPHADER